MRVILLGADGYLGSALRAEFAGVVTPKIDIANLHDVTTMLDQFRPDVVINAAGRTGRANIDWCETHRLETLHANVIGPLMLLEQCSDRDVRLVHIGTGCVYSGDKDGSGYCEADPPNYSGSFYSKTKSWVDDVLSEFPVLILRLRMPFDASEHPRNLISKLRSYPKLIDVQNSMTNLTDFTQVARALIDRQVTGIFNVCNPGTISPLEVMQLYREVVDPSHTCEAFTMEQLRKIVQADRSNCVLNSEKLNTLGIEIPAVGEAMRHVMLQMKQRRRQREI